MNNIKNDFPIFANNPGLVFLDNAASTQKPSYVINGIKHFLEHDYANIHRGAYSLSEKSEELYEKSKEKVKEFIGAKYISEINYTYNSTYAVNLLALSLKRSGILKKGDKILLSIAEHHANIVPWLILKEEIGIEIDYIGIKPDFSLDFDDLERKLTPEVKLVSLTYASNVTGEIFDLEKAGKIIKDYQCHSGLDPESIKLEMKIQKNPPLFVVDASQAVPNFKVDVEKLNCDFLFFTGHKVMAETGIGVLYGKKELLKKFQSGLGGGGAINWVKEQEYSPSGLPSRFEPGTPNIIGAVSLLKAFEYIESIGGYEVIEKNEKELVVYFLGKLEKYLYSAVIASDNEAIQKTSPMDCHDLCSFMGCDDELNIKSTKSRIKLIGSNKPDNRLGIFSLEILGIHSSDLADMFANENICIRAGLHCAEPLANNQGFSASLRISLYLYNDKSDIDRFFEVLDNIFDK
ncbi:MAG: cysteine desulfurase [Candidatus Gracilibacteria bacterium]|nr:cysteine desulfurase [Candidatus Gracilibacteria bacterium]MDD2909215.1 cysteine desulfurase [Candidatus Gracilibacteria bacterium]